jgi:hypothetical protein
VNDIYFIGKTVNFSRESFPRLSSADFSQKRIHYRFQVVLKRDDIMKEKLSMLFSFTFIYFQ